VVFFITLSPFDISVKKFLPLIGGLPKFLFALVMGMRLPLPSREFNVKPQL